MALPQQHIQPQYQPRQQQQQQEQRQSLPFRNLYSIDRRISPSVPYYNLQDQDLPQNQFYDTSFHIGFAPSTVPAVDGTTVGGDDMQLNFGLEPPRKRLKEQEFFNNASQITSIDFLQARSVSTGLALSLDNNPMTSSGDSSLFSLIRDDIERELQQQHVEIDRFLKVQTDQLRQAILEKVHSNQLQTLSLVEDKVFHKLREKEAEVRSITMKNKELEDKVEQLSVEAGAWQQQAQYSEHMISALRYNLQQVNSDSKEGCGDSEVDDTASCCNVRGIDFLRLGKDSSGGVKPRMMCKVCRVNEVSMLLLPCRHLCLCKHCESTVGSCPVCQTSKYVGMEVYMS